MFLCMSMNAQTIVKGDMNEDGDVTIADVTSTVDVILGNKAKETISLSVDSYKVDNSTVVGTWFAPDGTSFQFNEDGTTTFPGGATYEFMPIQGRLLVYDAMKNPIKVLPLVKVESEYLLAVDYATNTFTKYTKQAETPVGMSVEDVIAANPENTNATEGQPKVWITGYIVGYVDGTNIATGAQFTANGCETNSNLLLATCAEETNVEKCIPVQLPSGNIRADLNLMDNPTNLGKEVKVYGHILRYFGVSGLKNVTDYIFIETPQELSYVDLGLPSGTLWATCNIGANCPEEYGDYFAWGETTGYNEGKTKFDWNSYFDSDDYGSIFNKYDNNGELTELELADDAAYVNWGPAWRMPSIEQFDELINSSNTTTEWTTKNGVYGRKITSKTEGFTDRSLFLPAAGYFYHLSNNSEGIVGHYWSRTFSSDSPCNARFLGFYSDKIGTADYYRYYGRSVRPVRISESSIIRMN